MGEMEDAWRDGKTHEAIRGNVSGMLVFCLLDWMLPDELDPVSVWIESEGDALHLAVLQPLLKGVAGVADPFACGLDVVDGKTDVAEAFVGVFVAAGDGEVRIRLRAMAVRQCEDAFTCGTGHGMVWGRGAVVSEEIESRI